MNLGAGGSVRLGALSKKSADARAGGAEYYVDKVRRQPIAARRSVIASRRRRVGTSRGEAGLAERGLDQLGSLGGGNHFIELQRREGTGTLFVQVHTGSRGFGPRSRHQLFQYGEGRAAG